MDNPIFRKLPDTEEYFSLKSDERMCLDLRATSGYVKEAEKLERNDSKINLQITLKKVAQFNLRVRIWAYSLSEYLYVLSKSGLTLKHRTYAINQEWRLFRVINKYINKRNECFFNIPGKRGKQSVKKAIWYLGSKRKTRKRPRGKGFPLGLLASVGAPILGEVAKPILGKIFGRGIRRRRIARIR